MSVTKTYLCAFHAVAKAGGYSRAAKILNVSQSTLSAQVGALQKRFDVELFVRRGRHVELTQLGKQLQLITQRLTQAEIDSIELLSSSQSHDMGPFRLGSVQPHLVVELMKKFRDRFPKCVCTLNIANSLELIEGIRKHLLDCAIISLSHADPQIKLIPLQRERIVAIVGAEHRWFSHKQISIKDLSKETIILREEGSQTRRAIDEIIEDRGIRLNNVIQIDEWAGLRYAASINLGVGIINQSEARLAVDCAVLEITDCPIECTHNLAIPRKLSNTPLVRIFAELAVDTAKVF